MMKYLFIAFSILGYGQQYEFVENLNGYINIQKGFKHETNISINKGDVITFKVKVNDVQGNGAYLVGVPSYKNSFGFYKSSNKVRLISYYKTFDLRAESLDGTVLNKNDLPKGKWLTVKAKAKIDGPSLILGMHLYKGDNYDVRELSVNGIDLLPKKRKELRLSEGLFTTKGNQLFLLKVKGMATPEQFGWEPIHTNDQSQWKDASIALEKCFNSSHGCDVKGGIYPIKNPIRITKPTTIDLSGRGVVSNYLDNHSLAKIIPLGNFDVITIASKDVYINGGNIYTGLVKGGHDKAAIKYDSDGQIWGGELNRLTIQGEKGHLYKTGGGTRGIDFETQTLTAYDPHSSYLDFTNIRFEYLYSGISKKSMSNQVRSLKKGNGVDGLWINSLTILNPKFRGVKRALDLEWGSNIYMINANIQDDNVLSEEEKDFAIIKAKVGHSVIEYQPYDMKYGLIKYVDGKPIYRHRYYTEGGNETTKFINRFLKR